VARVVRDQRLASWQRGNGDQMGPVRGHLTVRAKEPSGLARLALVHLERTARFGLPRAELLREAGVTEDQLRDPDARIAVSALARLWRVATARVREPALGLSLGGDARPRDLGLAGHAMMAGSTVGGALRRLARYGRLVSDALLVQLVPGDGPTWVRLGVQPALRTFRPALDARLAALLSICRELSGAPVAPLSVQFPYPRPDNAEDYQRLFRAPIEFGAAATGFLLSRDDLARPVVGASEPAEGYLARLAAEVLRPVDQERPVIDQVRRVLWQQLSEGVPELEEVGRRLGMGPRTLQRRLRARGTTFAGVLMQLRRDMAPSLLRDGQLAVTEVAYALGYEDATSFHRSFRRWFGQSPRSFRRGDSSTVAI